MDHASRARSFTSCGWYLTWLEETRTAPEIPATFRSWSDYEEQTTTLRVWMPTIVDGLAQIEGYARALIALSPGVTAATAEARLTFTADAWAAFAASLK